MSSGWPPEEDDHRWEPVRHASVVGAGHDSRGAERGYSGYARYPSDADESGEFGPYDLPPSYDEDGWYTADGMPGPAHPSGPLPGPHGGNGGNSGADLYAAPVYTEADYGEAGAEGGPYEAGPYEAGPYEAGPYEAARHGDGRYEDSQHGNGQHGEPGYGGPQHGEAAYGQAQPGPARPGEANYGEGSYGPGHDEGAHYDGEQYAGEQYTDNGYSSYEPDGRHPGQQAGYQPGGYEGHEAGGYGQIGYGPGYGQAGYAGPPDGGDQPGAYQETGYQQPGYQDGAHGPRGYLPAPGHQGPGPQGAGAHVSGQPDYGYQDYGDPRYDDPSYGDLAFDDTPYSASAYRGTAPAAPSYPDAGFPDAGYGDQRPGSGGYPSQPGPAGPAAGYGSPAYPPGGSPGYAGDGYDAYQDGGALAGSPSDDDYAMAEGAPGYEEDPRHGRALEGAGGRAYTGEDYGPGPGFADAAPGFPDAALGFADADPGSGHGSYGAGHQPGYVAAEYASGQFPPGAGAIGELSAGMPDPAATGMLDTTGILDSSGLSDSVELYNYHPSAAEASQGFLNAPAPVGTLDVTGLGPSGFDDRAFGDHGTVLGGAEAADATGVLEGGSGFFDDTEFGDPRPAETTSVDLPAESLSRGPKTGGTGALLRPRPSSRPTGRRRGRSGDRRLWLALGGVMVVFVGALVAIVMVAFPSGPGGPAHTLVTPNQLNAFTRRPALEQQMNVAQLRQDVVNTSSGQARHVVEAVYEAGTSTSGTPPQIILFIGGNLLNAAPNVSVTSFTQRFKGAKITNAGGLGEAACVNATASQPGSVAMCAWFDNDSFGEVVSPTMNASALASTMRQIRPHVELVVTPKQ